MYNYSEGTKVTKPILAEKLHDEKKITDDEYNKLTGQNGETEVDVIQIGTITIDFSVLGTSSSKTVNDLEVGDYVKYGAKLTGETKKYETKTSETGYDSSQTFETDTNMLWRVISKSNGKVELVATKNVLANDKTTGLYFKGQNGFLNAETVLKNLCETLYNSDYGTARSIKVEDINNLTGYDPATSATDYNKPYTYTAGGPFWDKTTNTFKPVNSTVTVNNDDYYYTVDENIPLYDTLIAESKIAESKEETFQGGKTNFTKFYWLGSRCVDASDSRASFILRFVGSGVVACWNLFDAFVEGDPYENGYSCAVRPIVTLNSGIQITDGDGSQATPYEL